MILSRSIARSIRPIRSAHEERKYSANQALNKCSATTTTTTTSASDETSAKSVSKCLLLLLSHTAADSSANEEGARLSPRHSCNLSDGHALSKMLARILTMTATKALPCELARRQAYGFLYVTHL